MKFYLCVAKCCKCSSNICKDNERKCCALCLALANDFMFIRVFPELYKVGNIANKSLHREEQMNSAKIACSGNSENSRPLGLCSNTLTNDKQFRWVHRNVEKKNPQCYETYTTRLETVDIYLSVWIFESFIKSFSIDSKTDPNSKSAVVHETKFSLKMSYPIHGCLGQLRNVTSAW